MHGAYIEYDILNFSMHKYSKCTLSEYIFSNVVHTEIEYIILNTGTVRWVFYVYSERKELNSTVC